ncbi:MAG: D-alanine--D-alanine ligase [Planctomycetes bacterium]|nr:D-alanine--D-alanine ligase [Planctomycetota bacterium]MBL7145239.1 D-alanine--D-alanine ligase [Phycisphaerae bacterium]
MNGKLKIAVLTGGIGSERDISLQSGHCISQALIAGGFDVVTADIQPDNLDILEDNSIDVFFPALHGKFGEDGRLQQILQDKSLVYTGSGPAESKLAFDKMASKELFAQAGVATPAAIEFNADSDINRLEIQLKYLADGYVVKPIREGSSVGVRIVTDVQEVIIAAEQTLKEFGDCMIEQFIPGKEITVGILEKQTLPIIEIRSKTGFYDYQAKYIDEQTEYLFDTITQPALIAQIEQDAMDCFGALGCRQFARVDFILSDEPIAYALEVNTIPGFTTHSLLPKAAAKAGLTMSDFCSKIIEAAYSPLLRH